MTIIKKTRFWTAAALCAALIAAAGMFMPLRTARAENPDAYKAPVLERPMEDYYASVGGTQGGNNWYKLYGNPNDYYKMTYTGGQSQTWKGVEQYNGIDWCSDYSPDAADSAMIMWRAPYSGTVRFEGAAYKQDIVTPLTSGKSDGVTFFIAKKAAGAFNSESVFKQDYEWDFCHQIDLTYTVVSGEMYFFGYSVFKTNQYDSGKLFVYADFTKNGENPGEQAGEDIGDLATATASQYNSYFGTVQGYNNWYYLAGKVEGKYYLMDYSATDSAWHGTEEYNSIRINNQHPGNANDAIKMWRAPADGTADFIGKVSGSFGGSSNGILAKILVRRYSAEGYGAAEIFGGFSADLDRNNQSRSFTMRNVAVTRGDMFFFAVDSKGANPDDSNDFKAYIEFTKTADGADPGSSIGEARKIDSKAYYSDKQGGNNWWYVYGSGEKNTLMTYGMSNDGREKWIGTESWQGLDSGNQHPGEVTGTGRVWVADRDGVIAIEGWARKLASGGDGLRAYIHKNGALIWSHNFAPATASEELPASLLNLTVVKGDRFSFFVDSGGSMNNSSDSFLFDCEVYWKQQGSGYVEGEDLYPYVKDVTLLELIGVKELYDEIPEGEEDAAAGNEGCGKSTAAITGLITALAAGLCLRRKTV